jgi:beta-barrel assembly-enhancing protease
VAGVIAHEIGHITMHHGANRLVYAEGASIVNQLIFGSDTAAVSAQIAGMLESMAFLKFSRDDEDQADSCGVVYSSAAGYNPWGMRNFFQTLKDKYGDAGSYEVFSDHPSTAGRITHVATLISGLASPPAAGDTIGLHGGEYVALLGKI